MSTSLYGEDFTRFSYPTLNDQQVEWLGEQIFNNECNRQISCLTSWNEGEAFPSLGIGHFIWYQQGQTEIYDESFPALLRFLKAEGLSLPDWIEQQNMESPWHDRKEFLADFDSNRMIELRTFLKQHAGEQTAFIIQRFDQALNNILASINTEEALDLSQQQVRERVQENFFKVANSEQPYGIYALIDYVNFKGSGTSVDEKYRGQGWGLKQVLLAMDNNQPALPAFIQSARDMLTLRVQNAPVDRTESRWLNGWNNRLNTYNPK